MEKQRAVSMDNSMVGMTVKYLVEMLVDSMVLRLDSLLAASKVLRKDKYLVVLLVELMVLE